MDNGSLITDHGSWIMDHGWKYLGKIFNDKAIIKSIHLGKIQLWNRWLHTGTCIPLLVKSEIDGVTSFVTYFSLAIHVHALDNLHVDLHLLAELEQLPELVLDVVPLRVIGWEHLYYHRVIPHLPLYNCSDFSCFKYCLQ